MKARRILVLAPHPDDEVVGCAAAIRRARAEGCAVFGLYLTTGVPPSPSLWPWQRGKYGQYVARRRAEAIAAATALGIEPLGFSDRPSRSLKSHLRGALAEIQEALRHCAADVVWVPAWEGAHQDHDAANFLGALLIDHFSVLEFAEYNFMGAVVHSQTFPTAIGDETILRLTPEEAAIKRSLLALYRSERGNLAHVATEIESFRPLPHHDYSAAPHPGKLFRERFHWLPFSHPRVDFEPSESVRAALANFGKA